MDTEFNVGDLVLIKPEHASGDRSKYIEIPLRIDSIETLHFGSGPIACLCKVNSNTHVANLYISKLTHFYQDNESALEVLGHPCGDPLIDNIWKLRV